MDTPNKCATLHQSKACIVAVTHNVYVTLNPDQLLRAHVALTQARSTPDPDNPNLWSVQIDTHKLWGILDEGAGPDGEDVFTIMFPSDY